ncbi:MAG: hypothetical protein IKT00_06110 [Prevotella sp.]|nr:hypothetical protein [Prevotella sp.]
MKKGIVISSAFLLLFFCSCSKSKTDVQSTDLQTETQDSLSATHDSKKDSVTESVGITNPSERKITPEMAYEGVNNYCHSEYDWSAAEKDSTIMYVTMGEETASEYEVIFRSYTGAFVHFYVGKTNGTTRKVEVVPSLDVENEVGTFDLFDYLKKKQPGAGQ